MPQCGCTLPFRGKFANKYELISSVARRVTIVVAFAICPDFWEDGEDL